MALINSREDYARFSRYYVQLKKIYQEKPEVRASMEVLLTLVTISFFIVFAIRPTVITITSLLSDINAQREVQTKLDQKISDLSKARQVWTQEQTRLQLIDDALPTQPVPDLYLRQIEGLSSAHGVSLSSYAIEQTTLYGAKQKIVQELESQNTDKDTASVARTRIAFTVSGQFNNLTGFMTDLDSMRKVIQVENLTLSSDSNNKTSGVLMLKVTGYTPYHETKI